MMCDQNSCAIKIAKSRWSSTHKIVLSCSDVFNPAQQKQGILVSAAIVAKAFLCLYELHLHSLFTMIIYQNLYTCKVFQL